MPKTYCWKWVTPMKEASTAPTESMLLTTPAEDQPPPLPASLLLPKNSPVEDKSIFKSLVLIRKVSSIWMDLIVPPALWYGVFLYGPFRNKEGVFLLFFFPKYIYPNAFSCLHLYLSTATLQKTATVPVCMWKAKKAIQLDELMDILKLAWLSLAAGNLNSTFGLFFKGIAATQVHGLPVSLNMCFPRCMFS